MIAIFFVFGLIIGSFLNVVVYRINIAENFLGRSHCPSCKKTIRWFDNIPLLSFILLRARCRECQAAISWQYPLVEFFTGLLFMLAGWYYFVPSDSSTWPVAFYFLGIISFLVVILTYDYLFMEIPGLILWAGIFWTVMFNLYFDWMNWEKLGRMGIFGSSIYSGVLAGMVAFVFFFSLVAISREKWMGMGDAYLVIFLGLVLGWPKILLALFLAFAIGAVCGIILLALKKKELGSQVPFAPFLVLGTAIAIFFYTPIINWYTSLFSF